MTNTNDERIFVIERNNRKIVITIENNKMMKVVVTEGTEIYTIHRNGCWNYFDYKNHIVIRPRANGTYKIIGGTNNKRKMYCKAWEIEIECENIWRNALELVRHASII